MRAAVLREPNKDWVLEELEVPQLNSQSELIIKVKASGLCHSDIHMSKGEWGDYPIVPGHEVVGEVIKIGSDVNQFKIGDRVGIPWDRSGCGYCTHCIQGKIEFCPDRKGTGLDVQGGFAEFLKAPSKYFVEIPKGLSYAEAAPLLCAGYTVYGGLYHANVRTGQSVGVLGIGGLGHLGIQYAKAFGAKVIALTSSSSKINECRDFGASEVINISKDSWHKEVLYLGGLDVILCTTTDKTTISNAIKCLKPEGTLVIQGEIGDFVINSSDLIEGRKKVVGSVHGPRHLLPQTLDLAVKYGIKPVIEEYKLEQVNEALKKLEAGDIRYRAVITF